jgi:hypothetical protein
MGIVFTLGAFAYWGLGSFGYTPYMFILLARLIFFTWGEIFSLFPAIATDAYGAKQMLACSTPRRAPPSGSCLGQRHQELQQQLALGLRHRRDHEPEGRHAGAFHCCAHFHPFRTRIAPIALAALLRTLAAELDLLCRWYGEVSADYLDQ